MNSQMKSVHLSIAIPLIAAVVSWGLFLAAQYSDVAQQAQMPTMYDPDTPEVIRPSIWLLFAACAVFGLSSLYAQRKAIATRAQVGAHHALARAAHRFTNLAVIVALALSTLLAVTGFLSGFLGGASDNSSTLVRIANAYAPIVLYTALVVVLLLGAFVFRKATVPQESPAPVAAAKESGRASRSSRLGSRGALGLAYAAPIVLTAVALIIGLIVYDVTGTAPQVWVWVIIQALIGTGIVVGTVLARQARAGIGGAASVEAEPVVDRETAAPEAAPVEAPAGAPAAAPTGAAPTHMPAATGASPSAVSGARALNFVLSIIFGVVVTIMALSYGASAVSTLSIAPSLYVEVFPNGEMKPDGEIVSDGELAVTVNGYGLRRGSAVTATLEPGGTEVLSGTVDRDTSIYDQEPLPELEPGDYTVTAEARAADGEDVIVSFEFTIGESGELEMGSEKPNFSSEGLRLVTPTADWVLNDFLPALLLLLLACAGIYATIVARNRDLA